MTRLVIVVCICGRYILNKIIGGLRTGILHDGKLFTIGEMACQVEITPDHSDNIKYPLQEGH